MAYTPFFQGTEAQKIIDTAMVDEEINGQ